MKRSDILIRLGDEFVFSPGEVFDVQCVARTAKRRRCSIHVPPEQQTGWTYIRRPGEPDDSILSVYDLSFLDDDELTRWRNQHCWLHHRKEGVVNQVAPEWLPFDPAGYVWTNPVTGRWLDTAEPASVPG